MAVARSRSSRRIKPAGGFELFAWYFMRISGLVLVFLALGHLFIMHILNNVETINYEFVANRWTTPGSGYIWRIWDLMMINLAVLHGFNGLRQVLDEVITRARARVAMHTLVWVAATFLILVGSYAILMFEPDAAYILNRKATRTSVQRTQASPPAAPPARVAGR